MNKKSRLALSVGTTAMAIGLALGSPAAANAVTEHTLHFNSYSACHAEQIKSAYNNSYARVSVPCFGGGDNWWFKYKTL